MIDYPKHRNAWIDPLGKFIAVESGKHNDYAISIGSDEEHLENLGWVKVSTCMGWHAIRSDSKEFTKRQLETIFDFCVSHNLECKDIMDSEYLTIIDFKEKEKCVECNGRGVYYQKYPDCKNCESFNNGCYGASKSENTCSVPTQCNYCSGTRVVE